MDLNQCACSGKSLARLVQPAVMAVLARQPSHGYAILQQLEPLAMFQGQGPDATGLYRLLKSMEEKGLVVSSWDLADSGPAKRRYELTRRGNACLQKWVGTLEQYERAVAELLDMMKTTV
jgi:PadR family transcriptional regulator, regulatory protein PadR